MYAHRPVLRLRTRFLIPVLTAALPLAVFATAVVLLLWNEKQKELWEGQLNGARALAVAVGRDIEFTRAQLLDLAQSPLVMAESMATFRARSEDILRIRRDWRHIVLIDPAGNPFMRTGKEGNVAGRHRRPTDHVAAAIASRLPALSDVFVTDEGETLVSFVVPVVKDEQVVYALGAALKFRGFDELLRSHAQRSLVSLVDSRGRVISRNVDPAQYRGKPSSTALAQAVRDTPEGHVSASTFENGMVDAVWTTVPGTGWKIVVGHPSGVANGPLMRQIAFLAMFGALVLVTSVIIALRTSRRLHDAIEAAARHAADVAEGRCTAYPSTGTMELDVLGEAHAHAAAKIRQTEKERDELLVRAQDGRVAAEHANRAKDEFLAMLGHELRNPVAAISNSAEILQAPGLTPEQQATARGIIVRQTGHLTRLIDDLLDVGRVVSGRIQLRPEAVDLAQCASAGLANAKAAGKGLDRVVRLRCEPAVVWADRARLEQVIGNLIGNAVKYSPRGSDIVVETYRDADDAVLRITDHGIGLNSEQLKSIFELFYQAPRTGHRAGGLGIGLAVVKRIVELHHGSVEAESAGQGQGCRFTVRLPLLKGPAQSAPPPAAETRAEGITVVIVEDNRDARVSLEVVLHTHGHAVYSAADGGDGLKEILSIVPDAAIVDLDLPVMDGYEVARRVRAAGHTGMLLVAHSGYGQPDDVRRAKEAGFDHHLVKPADMQELRRLLAQAQSSGCSGTPLRGTMRLVHARTPGLREEHRPGPDNKL
ncbi:MAG TPA: ATP-binding protein [Burkholderiales bacterium]|nr:ATP-binding protein [Burkholderiales bacterium]